jgi:UDP-N-acetylmuramoyl-tripeptide--D-alanyl-D-alanine ligase
VRDWTAEQVAEAAGARVVTAPRSGPAPRSCGPSRAVIDSRSIGPGDLFVGIAGERVDGGGFAGQALTDGAWGVLVAPEHAEAVWEGAGEGVVLAADDPLAALQRLATAWRRALGAKVIGVTGSTGKTSTKDLLAAMVSQRLRTVATHANLNTEIGLPLTVLAAPPRTEVLVLEMAMRGDGQIAELATIAEPDVALITNIGPVHLEQMGSLEAIAAEKAAVVGGLRRGWGRPSSRRRTATRAAPARRRDGGPLRRRRRPRGLDFRSTPPTCASTRPPRWPPPAPSASSRAGASTSR